MNEGPVKRICKDCVNNIAVTYLYRAYHESNSRMVDTCFCRFGIPHREYEIRKCEAYCKRKEEVSSKRKMRRKK